VTGASADRRELLKMLNRLAGGDVVTVTRIPKYICLLSSAISIAAAVTPSSNCG
jgi:hypothetical protein